MYIVVGLGNPGSVYDGTRHNVGFGVIDTLARMLDIRFKNSGNASCGSGRARGTDLLLVKPLTYMNNSGEAVRDVLSETSAGPEGLIVCCDDLHLPLGKLRLRKKGSDGGHNGLYSVITELGLDTFARLRCGIAGENAPAPGEASADYVLSDFKRPELEPVSGMMTRAADSILLIVRNGIDDAMNIVNKN